MALPLSVSWWRPSSARDHRAVDGEGAAALPVGQPALARDLDLDRRRARQLQQVGDDAALRLGAVDVDVEAVLVGHEMTDASMLPGAAVAARDVQSSASISSGEASALSDALGRNCWRPAAGQLRPERDVGQVDLLDADSETGSENGCVASAFGWPRFGSRATSMRSAKIALGLEGRRKQRQRRPVDRRRRADQPGALGVADRQAVDASARVRPDAVEPAELDRLARATRRVRDQPGEVVAAALGQRQHGDGADGEAPAPGQDGVAQRGSSGSASDSASSERLADAGIDAEVGIAGLPVERHGDVDAQRAERRQVAQADAGADA